MANFYGRVHLYNSNNYGGASGLQTLGFYNFGATSYSGAYYHFKTNLTLNTFVMSRVEAIGHAYAKAAPIRCAWVWYTFSYLTSVGLSNIYTGMDAQNVYMSADGYVCFTGYISSPGDVSFTLNCVHANPTGHSYPLEITAVNQNSVSGNYY
jgi:hypothetical protein